MNLISSMFVYVNQRIVSIAAGATSQGVGNIVWTFWSYKGINVKILLRCLYVPDLSTRLIPPQQLHSSNSSVSTLNGAWLGGGASAKVLYDGHVIDFRYSERLRLALHRAARVGRHLVPDLGHLRHGLDAQMATGLVLLR